MKRKTTSLAAIATLCGLAPTIKSRVTPFSSHRGACAFKGDIEELTELVKSYQEDNKKLLKEATDAKAQVEQITKAYEEKVAGLNKDLGEKGATLAQIQSQVLELQAKTGQIAKGYEGNGVISVDELVEKAIEDNQEIIKSAKLNTTFLTDKLPRKCRWKKKAAGTITLSNNVTGASITGVPTFSSEIAARGYETTHLRDILQIVDSATGTYTFYQSNTPAGEGSVLRTTAGNTKNPLDKDLTLKVVNADYINGYFDIAKQSLQDIPMLQSFLNEELGQDFLSAETNILGGDLLAAINGPTSASGANAVEKLIYNLAAMMQRKYNPDFMLVRPAKWAEIMVTKPNDYSIPNAVIVTPAGTIAVVGRPLYVTAENLMDDSHAILGESRCAKIMQVIGEGMKMELFQQHDKAVYQNLLTMRIEGREALILTRTDAFSYPAI